jgi:hypothetical protein
MFDSPSIDESLLIRLPFALKPVAQHDVKKAGRCGDRQGRFTAVAESAGQPPAKSETANKLPLTTSSHEGAVKP